MPRYRRVKIEGGLFFFTFALADRSSDLLVRHIERARRAYAVAQERRPFETVAVCILPDHLHALWQLPDRDADYASRWSLFKSTFSRGLPAAPERSASKIAKREKGIWQRYWSTPPATMPTSSGISTNIHYNPVKHRLVTRSAGRIAVFTAMWSKVPRGLGRRRFGPDR